MKGLVVYYSNPKSPASVATKELYSYGDITLQDTVRGKNITYDVLSFFQVNLPVFTRTLSAVTPYVHASSDIIDFYSGVGTIGIALGATSLVETDDRNVAFARHNAGSHNITVIHAAAEHATQYIQPQQTVIVDPPRAGLHPRVIARLREVRPKRVVYLSCNPITQARDIALLDTRYRVTYAQGFNYFPRTPHIESLVVLE
jgi:23S rRNA (uracil1939-C5)-methyltransferase